MLSDGQGARELTQGQFEPQLPEINDQQQVAWWSRHENGGTLVELWEDGNIRTILDGGEGPHINNHGEITINDHGIILLYRDGEILEVTSGVPSFGAHDVNDWTEIAMTMGSYPDTHVYLMRRTRNGDADDDGRVELRDYQQFAACLIGPDALERARQTPTDTLCECRLLDIDHDNDVDLMDYSMFQNMYFGGS